MTQTAPHQWLGQLAWLALMTGVALAPFTTLRTSDWWLSADVAFLLAASFTLAHVVIRRSMLWLPWWAVAALALFVLGPFLDAMPDGDITGPDFFGAANAAFCVFLIPVVVANQTTIATGQVNALVFAWIGSTIASAVIAVMQAQGFELTALEPWLRQVGPRVAGMNLNSNSLGYHVALIAPVCLALALGTKRWLRFGAGVAAAALLLYAADLCGSRGGFVSGVCASLLAAAAFLFRREQLTVRFLQIVVVASAIALFADLRSGYEHSAIERLFGFGGSAAASDAERSILQQIAVDGFWQNPVLGNGYAVVQIAHHIFLSLLHSAGIVGLAGFLLMQVGCASYAGRLAVLAVRGQAPYGIAVGLAAAWAAWLLLGLAATPLLERVPYVGFGLAILLVLRSSAVAQDLALPVEPRWTAPAASGPR